MKLLQQLSDLHQDGQRLLRQAGEDKVADLGLSPELPLVVLLIDEAADLFTPLSPSRDDKALTAEATALVSTLVRQVGLRASPRSPRRRSHDRRHPLADPGLQTSKVALRCSTAQQVKAILADLASLAPVSPTAIPTATPGVAPATTATGGVVQTRVYDTSTSSRRSSCLVTGGQS